MFKFLSAVNMIVCVVLVVLTVLSLNSCSAADGFRSTTLISTSMGISNERWQCCLQHGVRLFYDNRRELEQIKPRRGGTVGLFAFPRVGRSDPALYTYKGFGSNQGSYEEYDDLQRVEWKRNEGLVPFPRVGRSDSQLRKWSRLAAQQDMDKRTGASANSGLWFGPRLGRIQKRAPDAGGLSGDHF